MSDHASSSDRLAVPPDQLPEFRFDLPELHYPERLNAAAELLKGGAPDALAVRQRAWPLDLRRLDDFSGGLRGCWSRRMA